MIEIMKTNRFIFMLAAAVAISACDKNAVQEDEITAPVTGSAMVKFFNFAVGGPGVNFYANDTKVTAISSTTSAESTIGTGYGGVGTGGLYNALKPGQYTFSGRIAAATDNGLAVAQVPGSVEQGKAYSVYLSGIYNTTAKTADGFMVEDVLPPLDYAVACVRFVNAISNSSPMALYARDSATGTETKIGSEVAYKSAGSFTCLPEGSYNLSIRVAGSATNVATRTAVSFNAGRVYTIAARGDVTATVAANRPFLDNTANR